MAGHPAPHGALLARYEELLPLFDSNCTLLSMQKTAIASEPLPFRRALSELLKGGPQSAENALGCLPQRFQEIDGAGINMLTEILHALDVKDRAVMNAISVEGLAKAGFNDYPSCLNKKYLKPGRYATFCRDANLVLEAPWAERPGRAGRRVQLKPPANTIRRVGWAEAEGPALGCSFLSRPVLGGLSERVPSPKLAKG